MPMPMPPGGMPGMPGPPGMPGLPPGMGDLAGMGADASFDAMNELGPKPANPTAAISKVGDALDKMHKLGLLCLPQVSQWNPKLTADLHSILKQIQSAKVALMDNQPIPPPPDLGFGMQGGMGLPTGQGPGMG